MTSGIIRRIDELGRIVIPKEIRKKLRIKDGDNLEIIFDDNQIYLKKFSHIENVCDMAQMYADSFNAILKYNIIITDCDKVIAASGSLKKKYLDNLISDEIINKITRRDFSIENKKKLIEICSGVVEECYYTFNTIINNGDSIGAVIIISLDTPLYEQEEKLGMILANIIGNYFI